MKNFISVMGLALVGVLVMSPASSEAAKRRASSKAVVGVVNLNTASLQQIDLLPGVGIKAATRIVEHRSKTPFTRPEELVKVKGFGKKKFEKLKPYLSVSGPSTLKAAPAGASASSPTAQGRTPAGR